MRPDRTCGRLPFFSSADSQNVARAIVPEPTWRASASAWMDMVDACVDECVQPGPAPAGVAVPVVIGATCRKSLSASFPLLRGAAASSMAGMHMPATTTPRWSQALRALLSLPHLAALCTLVAVGLTLRW